MNIKKNEEVIGTHSKEIKVIDANNLSEVKKKVKTRTLSIIQNDIELVSDMNVLWMMANSWYSWMIKSWEDIDKDQTIRVVWSSEKISEQGWLTVILKNHNISISKFKKNLRKARKSPNEAMVTNFFIVIKKEKKLYLTIEYNSEYNIFYIYFIPSSIEDEHIVHNLRLMIDFVETRDIETAEHQKRVTKVCVLLSCLLSKTKTYKKHISHEFIAFMNLSARLHDLWKIWIQDKVLLKPWKLTDEEFCEIKKHCEIGCKIVKKLENKFWKKKLLTYAQEIVLYHHERQDWKWYPYWLRGDEIPLSAQIVAIVDVFDAVLSKRPYKEALSKNEAKKIIELWKWTQFNERIVDVFMDNFELLFDEREKS